MGMIGYFFRASNEEITQMQNGQLMVSTAIFQKENQDRLLDIDKAWNAIFFLMDKEGSFSFANLKAVNEEDMGYGPAMLIPKEEISRLAEGMKAFSEEHFREIFHIEEMLKEGIYPVMNNENETEFFQYVWENFVVLRDFLQDAVKEQHNVLFMIL